MATVVYGGQYHCNAWDMIRHKRNGSPATAAHEFSLLWRGMDLVTLPHRRRQRQAAVL